MRQPGTKEIVHPDIFPTMLAITRKETEELVEKSQQVINEKRVKTLYKLCYTLKSLYCVKPVIVAAHGFFSKHKCLTFADSVHTEDPD